MVLAGEEERLLDPRAVDRDERFGRMLLDDREQVAQQDLLALREVGPLDAVVLVRMLDPVDLRARRDRRCRLVRQAATAVALLRNARPSSSCWL
ncbi:MAG: hypothetical protein ACSLFR_11500 [Solirubrobacteraceae bacterium]